jgi:hypothetical protein
MLINEYFQKGKIGAALNSAITEYCVRHTAVKALPALCIEPALCVLSAKLAVLTDMLP